MTLPPGGMPPPIDDETLSAWIDGELSDTEREAVTAAMARDPELRERARDLRVTVALLRALPQPVPRRSFVLTPERAAPFRPARVVWLTRLFPAVTAATALTAVLCLALFIGDLRTSGFRTTTQPAYRTSSRAVPETIATDTVAAPAAPRPAATAAAGSVAAGAAAGGAPAPAAAAATTASSAGSVVTAPGGPPAAALPAPTAAAPAQAPTATVAVTATAPPTQPTVAAAVRATDTTASNSAQAGGATVQPTAPRRVSLALVRTGEIVLLLFFLVGLAFAIAGWRTRKRA